MKIPEALINTLRDNDLFIIASHINPDGDTLGSSIALTLALKSLGKKVNCFSRDGVPAIYQFLPCSDLILTTITRENFKNSVLVILDCNEIERVGLEEVECKEVIVIDHHRTIGDFGTIRWIVPECTATGLMIYYLLDVLEVKIDANIATNLYTAIAIDTGTFRYENINSDLMRVVAELIEAGADPECIAQRLYESWTMERFRLLAEMLKTLEFVNIGQETLVAITTITQDMFAKTGTDSSDAENFSNFPRMIKEVNISAMFREVNTGSWKASLRSKGSFDVSVIASFFGGGGHKNAAGYNIQGDIHKVKESFIEAVKLIKVSKMPEG